MPVPAGQAFATMLRSTDRDRILVQLVAEVWDSALNLAVLSRDDSEDLDSSSRTSPLLSGSVAISGIWEGSVVMCVPSSLAAACGALMYGRSAADLTRDEVYDSWGELVNMVGGNVKALLPAPTRLSLPIVREASSWRIGEEGANLMNEVTFACLGQRMRFTLLKRPT